MLTAKLRPLGKFILTASCVQLFSESDEFALEALLRLDGFRGRGDGEMVVGVPEELVDRSCANGVDEVDDQL